jgi:hypothetical protein
MTAIPGNHKLKQPSENLNFNVHSISTSDKIYVILFTNIISLSKLVLPIKLV